MPSRILTGGEETGRIRYSNVTMHGMSIDDRKTFLDVTTDEKMIETSVQGIDRDNNVVYKYD
ncbi:hypothetical protein MH215_19890 [Paenibacillus sp. ACRSA]|uniref:hypothetical protein n=1 Tax=Paenibacillus sp. ACRSA TaxID=2918211 RepID=UPI001EF4F77F|nr:hypothetical protein [Paenibacillus sp. ACRSA]MCG7379264.1 hypothetical protein [Paenibacillus sp. ACRSA]